MRYWGLAIVSAVFALSGPAWAQTPPAEFTTNLTQGSTTLNCHFYYHPLRSTNFAVYLQDASGAFTTVTADVPRTYLGWASNAPNVLAGATLLPNGQIWARVVFGDGNTWFFQNGSTTASSTRGSTNWTAQWPTTPTLGVGGAGTNIYAADAGVDMRWSYFSACGGDITNAVRHIEQSVLAQNLYYLQDAGILHRLQRVVLRGSQTTDPYESTTSSLLNTLHNQWSSTLPAALGVGLPDVSVLPSPGYGGGVAYLSEACTSLGNAVTDVRSLEFDIVWRHECGHNWGAGDNQGGNAEGGTIMNGNGLGRFAGTELYKMVAYRNNHLSSLQNLGPYSFKLPPYAALDLATTTLLGTVPIDVLANDHDGNGDALTLLSFDTTTAKGAVVTRSVGTGPGGRDQLLYTANLAGGAGLDRFTYTIKDATGMQTMGNVFVQVNPALDAVAGYWALDETNGLIAVDGSGLGNNGMLQGGVSHVGGMVKNALRFDGVSGTAAVPALKLNANTATLACWVRRLGPQNPFAGLVFCRGASTIAGLNLGPTNDLRYTWDGASSTYNFASGLTLPDGQWCFAAVVVEPTRATLYLDDGSGLRSVTNAVSHNAEAFDATTYFGWDSLATNRYFQGELDEVRVLPRALGPAEVTALAQGCGTAANPSPAVGAVVLAGPQTLSWTGAAAATTHQVFLGTNYVAVRDATPASPEFQGTVTVPTYPTAALGTGTYYWRVDEVRGGAAAKGAVWFFVVPAEDGSVARWKLDETSGSVASDAVGAFPGTYLGTPLLGQNGTLRESNNKAVLFSTNQFVEMPYNAALNPTQFTAAVWCKVLGGQGSWRSPLTSRDASGAPVVTKGFCFYAGNNDQWQFWAGSGGTSFAMLSGPAVATNQWVHLVGSYDGGTLRLYVNGLLVDSADTSFLPNDSPPLRIGAGSTEGAASCFFNGLVDDVRFYGRALSDDEIADLYQSGANLPPAWSANPVVAASAQPAVAYSNSIASFAADPNGDALTFSKVSGPAWLSMAANGTLSGTPSAANADSNSFVVRVTDSGGLTADTTLQIPVGGAFWTGSGTSANWSEPANWQGVAPAADQTLVFHGLLRRANTNNLLAGVGQLVFQGNGFALSGGPISLTNGILNSAGGNLCNLSLTLRAPQTFDNGGGVLQLNGSVNLAGQPLSVNGPGEVCLAGPVRGPGTLVLRGTGTLALAGANTFTGDTLVTGGTLALRGTGNLSGSNIIMTAGSIIDATEQTDSTLVLGAGQILRGEGQVSGTLVAGAGSALGLGTTPGLLSVTGAATLRGTTVMKVQKNGAALASDQLSSGGLLDLGGALFVTNSGGTFAAGDSFQLFTAAAFANDFATLALPTLSSGLQWTNRLAIDGSLAVIAGAMSNVVTSVTNGLWTDGTTWSDGNVPTGLNNYVVLHQVQAPDDNNHTFGGKSMTVQNGGRLYLYRSNSGGSLDIFHRISNLALASGSEVRWASSLGSEQHYLTNTPQILISGAVSFYSTGGSYSLGMTIGGVTGNGTITYTVNRNYSSSAAQDALTLTQSSPNFSGNWVVNYANSGDDYAVLNASAPNALGSGTVTLKKRSWLQSQAAGGLNSLAGVTLAEPTAQLVLNQPWNNAAAAISAVNGASINLGSSASTMGSLTVAGIPVASGSYNATQLTALGLTASGSGSLTVTGGSPQPPVWSADPLVLPAATNGMPYVGTLAGQATDPNAGNTLSFSKLSGPAWLSVAANGQLAGTPATSDAGTGAFLVQALDNTGLHAEAVLQISVLNTNIANHAPSFSSNPVVAADAHEMVAYSDSLANYASDPDLGDLLTFAKLSGPAWLNVAADGTLSGTPVASDGGTNAFTVSVRDLAGATNQATLLVAVAIYPVIPSIVNGFWDAATTWSDGDPPAITNRYLGLHQVQSPDDGDHTFGGYSMTVTNGGKLYLYRSNAGSSISAYHRIPNLSLLTGATVQFRSSNGSLEHYLPNLVTVAGTVTFLSTDSSYDNNMTLSGGVSGSGTINYNVSRNASGTRSDKLGVTAASPGYSGSWVVDYTNTGGDDFAVFDAAAPNALGTGTVTLKRRSWLRCQTQGGLDSLRGVVLSNNTSQLILTYPWVNSAATLAAVPGAIVDLGSGTNAIGVLVIGGATVANGTYTAAQLNSLGLSASNTGCLVVGSEPATPPTLSMSAAANSLSLSWPMDYTSFRLFSQTNSLNAGLGTHWWPVPGVVSNTLTLPLGRTNPTVFFRLQKP